MDLDIYRERERERERDRERERERERSMVTCTGLLQTKIYCEYAGGRCYGYSPAAVATVYSY